MAIVDRLSPLVVLLTLLRLTLLLTALDILALGLFGTTSLVRLSDLLLSLSLDPVLPLQLFAHVSLLLPAALLELGLLVLLGAQRLLAVTAGDGLLTLGGQQPPHLGRPLGVHLPRALLCSHVLVLSSMICLV